MTDVLVVDDDPAVMRTHARLLTQAGLSVVTSPTADAALKRMEGGLKVQVVVTDLVLPGLDGLGFLKAIRRFDLDVSVIVVTAFPTLGSAARAMGLGVFRYLTKPAGAQNLLEAVRAGIAAHQLALLKRRSLELFHHEHWHLGDRATLERQFDAAIDELWMAYQPIVNWRKHETIGYEALVRSHSSHLATPELLLGAAERLGRVRELGQRIRRQVVHAVEVAPVDVPIFVNLHAADLNDDSLYTKGSPFTDGASRIVLEITERSSLERVPDVRERAQVLRSLGFRIAVDDLGAGYAGLSSFAQLDPDLAKIDMSLIRDIEGSAKKQSLVRAMIEVCRNELGVEVVCEGVETPAERDTVDALGSELQQGYLFGRPNPEFLPPRWPSEP